jgi:hypothetical protein
MTMSNHPHSDTDGALKSYLDGSDGLSAAYQQLDQEQPPATLDARILAAARGAVPASTARDLPPARATTSRPPRRALAATFMVCALSAMFYFSQRDTRAPAFSVPSEAETAAFSRADDAGTEDAAAKRAAPAAMTVSGSLAPRAAAPAPAPAERTSVVPVRGSLAPPGTATSDGAVRFSTQPDESRVEINVTGSTAPAGAASGNSLGADTTFVLAPPGYRDSRDNWLQYLRDLQRDIDASTTAEPRLEALTARLAQEKADFANAYPDADLDALLDAP